MMDMTSRSITLGQTLIGISFLPERPSQGVLVGPAQRASYLPALLSKAMLNMGKWA